MLLEVKKAQDKYVNRMLKEHRFLVMAHQNRLTKIANAEYKAKLAKAQEPVEEEDDAIISATEQEQLREHPELAEEVKAIKVSIFHLSVFRCSCPLVDYASSRFCDSVRQHFYT